MKVCLLEDIPSCGKRGTVIDVSDGYARNYLIPKHLAVFPTPSVMQAIQARRARGARDAEKRKAVLMKERERLTGHVFRFRKKANATGKLFGAVHPRDLVRALRTEFRLHASERELSFPQPLETLGNHTVEFRPAGVPPLPLTVAIEEES